MQAVDRPLHGVFVIGSDLHRAIGHKERLSGAILHCEWCVVRDPHRSVSARMFIICRPNSPLVMDQKQSVDIDTVDDLKLAEAIQDVDMRTFAAQVESSDT